MPFLRREAQSPAFSHAETEKTRDQSGAIHKKSPCLAVQDTGISLIGAT